MTLKVDAERNKCYAEKSDLGETFSNLLVIKYYLMIYLKNLTFSIEYNNNY